MSISMHEASVPLFTQTLSALSNVLDKAVSQFEGEGKDIGPLIDLRLATDMMTLAQQIQQACHHATLVVARCSNTEQPVFSETDTKIEGMMERLAVALKFLKDISPDSMDGSAGRRIEIQLRIGPLAMTGQNLLFHFSIPQVMFHATTAYDLLRHAGAEIGKIDFLGDAFSKRLD